MVVVVVVVVVCVGVLWLCVYFLFLMRGVGSMSHALLYLVRYSWKGSVSVWVLPMSTIWF